MKIKWKIVTVSVGICLLLTLSIVSFTHKEINILITEESNEELKNYSSMGLQLFDKTYAGEWKIKDGKLYKGETLINENYEVIDDFTNGTKVLATIFQNDTSITSDN